MDLDGHSSVPQPVASSEEDEEGDAHTDDWLRDLPASPQPEDVDVHSESPAGSEPGIGGTFSPLHTGSTAQDVGVLDGSGLDSVEVLLASLDTGVVEPPAEIFVSEPLTAPDVWSTHWTRIRVYMTLHGLSEHRLAYLKGNETAILNQVCTELDIWAGDGALADWFLHQMKRLVKTAVERDPLRQRLCQPLRCSCIARSAR